MDKVKAPSVAKQPSCKVVPCTCKNEGQDRLYGVGNRLMNWARKANTTGGYRCTVCGKVHQ